MAVPKKKDEAKTEFIVKSHITRGEVGDAGDTVTKTYEPGSRIMLTAAEAESMPWALHKDRRSRAGQTTRLQKQIKVLMDQQKALTDAAKRSADKTGDPELQAALDSIRDRADNFAGRGEPQIGSVPQAVVDEFDRREAADLAGDGDGDGVDVDAETGGKGLGRETA